VNMEAVERFFDENYGQILWALGVIVFAILSYFIFRRVLVRLLRYAAKKTRSSWGDVLVEQGVFGHLPYLAPAAVFYLGARVFPEELLRVFPLFPVEYHCPYDPEKVTDMLRRLGREEVQAILAERGEVLIRNEMCNHEYRFDAEAVERIFAQR